MKDQIFISHATPEDNDFTIWLASRLEMRGYKVWIDKNGLLGGERFWQTIQQAIFSSRKFLLVYSNNIVKNGILKKGIEDELEYAKSLVGQKNDTDFVIPLHIDSSPYNLIIGLPNINHIPFDNNWAQGLTQLLKKLDKDNVLYDSVIESTLNSWYESNYSSDSAIIDKKELYYSSWWSIKTMPNIFYMYQFKTKEQASFVKGANSLIPIAQLSNFLSSFDGNLNFNVLKKDGNQFFIKPQEIFSFSIDEIINGFESSGFPTQKDVENYFKDYLRCLIHTLLYRKGFRKAELANKRIVFFLPIQNKKFPRITFTYKFSTKKKKTKSLVGKFKDIGFWHYGISILPIVFPFVGVSIKSHLIFTKDGKDVIQNKGLQHSYRRSKGKNFFNEQWRDMLLALLASLKDSNGNIDIAVTKDNKYLEMKPWPETFWSDFGYKDPSHPMSENEVENIQNEEES